MSKTRRVRIAVAINPEGSWDACGYGFEDGNADDGEVRDNLLSGWAYGEPEAVVHWIEAEVPIPEPRKDDEVIEGEVWNA